MSSTAVASMFMLERDQDLPGVAIPRPEVQIVVRFGPTTQRGVDVHALAPQESVIRKTLRRGLRCVMARLHLGAHEAVLGAPVSALSGHRVPLEALWGEDATRTLRNRLADATSTAEAALVLERAITERSVVHRRPTLALDAAARLATSNVTAVAADLGVSERHLRRVFRESIGVSPKTFARVARFRRAVRAARAVDHAGWACIAADAGYYDQAHLIAEFHAIAGATPQALLDELRISPW